MKKIVCLTLLVLATSFVAVSSASAEEKGGRFEYAIVKWDGPDRLYYNLPDKFELIRLDKGGIRMAKDAQEEEFSLAYACNHLAKDGWEAVNLDSRRVLFRRAVVR